MSESPALQPSAGSLSTPRAAGLAGVAFALLFGVALALVHASLPQGLPADIGELTGHRTAIRVAVGLMPFAGIAFLWFVAAVRDGLGASEDRFYSTVFLGSSLVFLAMVFVSIAVTAGVGEVLGAYPDSGPQESVVTLGVAIVVASSKTFAVRMAAVSMMSLATIWLKSGVMPRWLAIVSYLTAVALLTTTDLSVWISMAYPAWALVVSLMLLRHAGVWGGKDGAPGA